MWGGLGISRDPVGGLVRTSPVSGDSTQRFTPSSSQNWCRSHWCGAPAGGGLVGGRWRWVLNCSPTHRSAAPSRGMISFVRPARSPGRLGISISIQIPIRRQSQPLPLVVARRTLTRGSGWAGLQTYLLCLTRFVCSNSRSLACWIKHTVCSGRSLLVRWKILLWRSSCARQTWLRP